MKDGHGAITPLSWQQLSDIAARFAKLNPYGTKLLSILKICDNFDPITGNQRQLYCLAISAKRYALFMLDENGQPVLLRRGINNHEDCWSSLGNNFGVVFKIDTAGSETVLHSFTARSDG